jgi:N-acetylglucosamine-6-phosphate deacetylase
MEADADDLHRVALFLAQNGVTAWLPTLVPAPFEDYERAVHAIEKLMNEQDERAAVAARVLGLHYEGPFINSAQCGALRPAYFQKFTDKAVLDSLAVLKDESAAHMITVAPEIDGGIELVEELAQRGWIISIGHTRAGLDVLELACEAGARHMTHFMNAMSPLHHREPGPIGWGLMNDRVSCDIIADGVHVDPLMLKLVLRAKTPARVALISDAVAPAGLGDGEYNIWGETISVIQGRTRNARGSIAGSVITMRDAVRLMLSLDVPVEDVARMASGNPARLLGVDRDCGSIEEGKRADLVALDTEGNVRLTLVSGRIARNDL